MNVFDWLNNIPLSDSSKPFPVMEVTFNKGSRKEFFRNSTHHLFEKGDWVAVEGIGGYDLGQVSLMGELVKLQMKKYGVTDNSVTKRVLHPATDEEVQFCMKQKEREPEILIRSRAISRSLNLDMKLCEVEIQADSKKGTFFYTADQRVDFRELIKLYAGDFKLKVEMRQIGARQESSKVGGIGSCGRELCCSTWLTDFKSVNTTAARYQNLSINQTKLSGQCGRLKCCLNYELDTYMDALSVFPDHADKLETVKGIAQLQKRDIFKNLMWYSYSENNKQYPLSIERVKEIQKLNKLGQKADELQPVELETRESKAGILPDAGFINDVGQLSLKSLEKGNHKKKNKGGSGKGPQQPGGNPNAGAPRENQPNQGSKQQGKKPNQPQKQGQPGEPRPNAAARPNDQQGGQKVNQPQKQGQPQGNRPKPQQGGGQRPNQPQPNRDRDRDRVGATANQAAKEGVAGTDQNEQKPVQPQQQKPAQPQPRPAQPQNNPNQTPKPPRVEGAERQDQPNRDRGDRGDRGDRPEGNRGRNNGGRDRGRDADKDKESRERGRRAQQTEDKPETE